MTALTRRTLLAGLSATALAPQHALAAWPERNITMMHGLAAGGGVDVSARLIADGLSKRLGQQIVVEPRPGAAARLRPRKSRALRRTATRSASSRAAMR